MASRTVTLTRQNSKQEFERPAGDDHDYTYPGALSKWHDEQLQSVEGTNYTIEEDFDLLEKRPDPPDALPEDAIPICPLLMCGDVQWTEANAPGDPDFYDLKPGTPDTVFDALADINRFAFHRFEGSDCIVGWVYLGFRGETDTLLKRVPKVVIRDDVRKRYASNPEDVPFSDGNYWVENPLAYGEEYDAYTNCY